jgi:hypothetical protein
MTKKLSGRTAILAIGLLMGLSMPSFAGPFDAQADNSAATAPANPADAQAAPAGQTAGTDQQLSDADRAARQDDVKQPVVVTQQQQPQQTTETPPARANPVVAGSQNATWDETSLIGKIFIGFGALLTIASAARMFMA